MSSPRPGRHSYLVSLLGIRSVTLAVNKMDLVDFKETVFTRIVDEYREFVGRLGLEDVTAIPVSALRGDNVTVPSPNMPWYTGPPLMPHLESVEIDDDQTARPFRMPVQLVTRPGPDFRGFAGPIVGGVVAVGDRVRVLPSGARAGWRGW